MSEKETKKKEQQIYDLMASIRKNTQHSAGIDVFESLLKDIQDTNIFNIIVADMNDFIANFMVTVKNVDMMENLTIKSKILTYDFIEPKRYFVKSYRAMLQVMSELKSYNMTFHENRTYNMSSKNMLGLLPAFDNPHIMGFIFQEPVLEDKEKVYEEFRKIFLLWNYMPAIVKALIMTKRRSLGLDTNSKKFANV